MALFDDFTMEQRDALLRLVDAEVDRFSREEAFEKARARLGRARKEFRDAEYEFAKQEREREMLDYAPFGSLR